MQYDPIKDRLGSIFRRRPFLQSLFYRLLDLLFLRAWYVRRAVRRSYPDRSQPLRVLDAGTGFGQWVRFLAARYPKAEILGVDIKRDYLDMARAFFERTRADRRIRFEEADLTRLDMTEAFDLILSVDVMEHIEDDVTVLRNLGRALRPGGRLIINTPSDLGGSDVQSPGDSGFIGEHVREGYGREELSEKIHSAGLAVERSEYSYGSAGSLAWRLLIKWPLLLLNRSFWAIALLPLYYLPVLPVGFILHLIDLGRSNQQGTGLLVVARKSPASAT